MTVLSRQRPMRCRRALAPRLAVVARFGFVMVIGIAGGRCAEDDPVGTAWTNCRDDVRRQRTAAVVEPYRAGDVQQTKPAGAAYTPFGERPGYTVILAVREQIGPASETAEWFCRTDTAGKGAEAQPAIIPEYFPNLEPPTQEDLKRHGTP